MGLSWQQGPLGRNANVQFLVPGMPQFEPGRYPVAYFPLADFADGVLTPSEHRSMHRDLGETAWFEVDPYHRIDIRHTSRRLVVRAGERVVADTTNPLVLYESGFAARWYVPRADVVAETLTPTDVQTFCPCKGVASYYDIEGVRDAAWSYRAPFDDMAAISDLISFEPDRVEVTLDEERLEAAPGQNVVSHGVDRDLSVGEAGALRAVPATNA